MNTQLFYFSKDQVYLPAKRKLRNISNMESMYFELKIGMLLANIGRSVLTCSVAEANVARKLPLRTLLGTLSWVTGQ